MKKAIVILFLMLCSFVSMGQTITYRYPFDFGMSVGMATLNTPQVTYRNASLPNTFLSIGVKMCGIVASFGSTTAYPNESVLGYGKQISMDYTKFGLELGKLYIETSAQKQHTFSIAPTYTKIKYRLCDGSGNNIGWEWSDYSARDAFYAAHPNISEFGIDIGYTYQMVGIDFSISKSVFDISVIILIDFRESAFRQYMHL